MPRDAAEPNVTELLVEWRRGDPAALERLIPIVYGEMRRVASARLRGERSQTLQTTALVHEVYLRLVEFDRTDKIFTNPREKITEDYVTGRFG